MYINFEKYVVGSAVFNHYITYNILVLKLKTIILFTDSINTILPYDLEHSKL